MRGEKIVLLEALLISLFRNNPDLLFGSINV
jgi:hypothetical protein